MAKYSKEIKDEVISRRLNREPIERIAMKVGVPTVTVSRWCAKAGVQIDQRAAVKAKWPPTTDEQKTEVLRLRAQGLSFEKISPIVRLSTWQAREVARKDREYRQPKAAAQAVSPPPPPRSHPTIIDDNWIKPPTKEQLMSGGRPILR